MYPPPAHRSLGNIYSRMGNPTVVCTLLRLDGFVIIENAMEAGANESLILRWGREEAYRAPFGFQILMAVGRSSKKFS